MTEAVTEIRRPFWAVALFAATLAVHFYFATFNWHAGFLPGHEFRQTQTAIISYYIDKENDFSLNYPDPLLGKPWTFPMEFPLYEWSVVGLSRATGWPHHEAARAVSLGCFYALLPAVYLLLGVAGQRPAYRLVTLALVLTCPVYIFYSRAFLMESMALMFSVWFLAAFMRTIGDRRWPWLVLCTVAGSLAGLIKSTTFMVWLLPAALYGAWLLGSKIWRREGWREVGATIAWGVGPVVLPGVLLFSWVGFTDAIKAQHASAFIFTSKNLSTDNFGLYDLSARYSADTWRRLLDGWRQAVVSPWLIAGYVVVGVVALRRERWFIVGSAAFFLAAQLLFPFAYALQEYYFYACAIYVLAALGFVLTGVMESRLPRWAGALVVLVPLAAQLANYVTGYRVIQSVPSNGGYGLTAALRDLTPPGSVIVVAGDDWTATIPYYSQRKALMIRNGLEYDERYLERAFRDLADEDVSVLLMARGQRENRKLVERAAAAFDLDSRPAFSHPVGEVYVKRTYRNAMLFRLQGNHGYDQVTARDQPSGAAIADSSPKAISPAMAASSFGMVKPAPIRYQLTYDYAAWPDPEGGEGKLLLGAHPAMDLWVPPPAGAKRIEWEFGIFAEAYEREGDKTDGVEFSVVTESRDGTRREIYRRVLDPVAEPADRGRQRVVIPVRLNAGETLVFQTRPNASILYDWAYFARIKVE